MTGKKLFKERFSDNDVFLVHQYVSSNHLKLGMIIWEDAEARKKGNGDYHTLKVNDLTVVLDNMDYYVEQLDCGGALEVVTQLTNGEYSIVYHYDDRREGLYIPLLRLLKQSIV